MGTLPWKNPFLVVTIEDFNAKSESWYFNDSTASQGNVLENIKSQFGLQQIIKEPTHILDNSNNHQVVYAKFNLQVYYLPQYYWEFWYYKDSTELIRRAIDEFNWQKAFSNKNINEKEDTFSKIIQNILSNFIPHETLICNDRDPPWFNSLIIV